MFDTINFQMYWPRLCVGGPLAGTYHARNYTSVPPPGYTQATWYNAEGHVISEIHQHDSIRTQEDFQEAIQKWQATKEP